jgi:TolA-binding protein
MMYKLHRQTVLLIALCGLAMCANSAWAGPADDQFAVAAGHYERGRWQLAADEFEAYLTEYAQESTERSEQAYFFRGEALVQLGQNDLARDSFQEFLGRAPSHKHAPRALFRIAEIAYLTGDSGAARHTLQRFRGKYPNDDLLPFVLPYLGELTLEAGDAAGAQDIYVDALGRFPTGPRSDECRFGLGRALQQQGDAEAAARFFTPLAAQAKSPKADDAQLQLGIMQYNEARFDEAAETLNFFESTFADSEFRGEARYWEGLAHLAQRNWDPAIVALEDAAQKAEPARQPEIAFYTAKAYVGAERLEEAIHHFDRTVANWPEHAKAPAAELARLEIYLQQGDHAAVTAQTQQFVRRYPDSPLIPNVSRLVGRSLLARQEYARAVDVYRTLVDGAPRSSDVYFLAVAQLGTDDYERALATLNEIALTPEEAILSDAVYVARASALMGLTRYEEAVAPLTAYLASQPNGPDAAGCRADLVVALAATGQVSRARNVYREYADRHSDHSALLATAEFLAEAAAAAGDRETAREMFAVLARESNPEDVIAKGLSGLARIDLDPDDPAASRDSFERLLGLKADKELVAGAALHRARAQRESHRYDAALATYRVIIDDHPQSDLMPAALWETARLHVQLKQYREAAPLLERLVRDHPQVPYVDRVLYQWAWLLVDMDRADDADAVFTRLNIEHPQSDYWPDATYRLAERAAGNQDPVRARKLATQVIEADPDGEITSHSLYLLGQIAIRAGDWEGARPPLVQLCEQCTDSPLCPAAEYWLAEVTYRLGEYEDAQRRFDNLAKRTGQVSDKWPAMVELRRAQVLARQKNWADSLGLASSIAELFPDFERQYEADYLIGRCLASQGRFREARAAYQRVVRSDDGRHAETAAMAQWMIGETFFHQKDFDAAVRAYSRVEILWDYPRWKAAALLQIGKCHEIRGQWQPATESYRELTSKYPETRFAKEGQRRLSVVQQRAAHQPPNLPQTSHAADGRSRN